MDLLVEVIQRWRVWCVFGQALSNKDTCVQRLYVQAVLMESTAPAGALVANTRPAAATTASKPAMIFMASPKQTPIFHCSSHQDHRPNPAVPTVPRNSLAAWGQGKELT